MTERRRITEEQARSLERYLTKQHGPPLVEEISVDDEGTIHTTESWGDVKTRTRRMRPEDRDA